MTAGQTRGGQDGSSGSGHVSQAGQLPNMSSTVGKITVFTIRYLHASQIVADFVLNGVIRGREIQTADSKTAMASCGRVNGTEIE